VEVIISVIFSN